MAFDTVLVVDFGAQYAQSEGKGLQIARAIGMWA